MTNKIHACQKCTHSCNFEKPISMTYGAGKIHQGFTCKKPALSGAYGKPDNEASMILELTESVAWVDGGDTVREDGCINYERDIRIEELEGA